ncbi:MAG: hypothetical protein HY287_13400 [Planctomycetes bacterium]|nr:hypothetical protein [Planctomycetota bacterium]MBI3835319.1 hypothetical protein [Planctomycetota bacterium]
MRTRVAHAALSRDSSERVIVGVELLNGVMGYGETLPCEYVAGETVVTLIRDLQEIFAPAVMKFHAKSFPEALESIDALPCETENGRIITAARAAIELALLDASMRAFDRDMDAIVQWMELAGFGSPGSINHIRFSGVLAIDDDRLTMRTLRRMYWAGFRDFKLKVGFEGDIVRLKRVVNYLRKAIARGRVTLRVDANGAWSPEEAAHWIAANSDLPIAAIEQPVPRGTVPAFRSALESSRKNEKSIRPTHAPLPLVVYDESVITRNDAEELINLGGPIGFNIRICRCGGLLPSLRLAALARRAGVAIQLGCMAGETSILFAAGLRFLEACPEVRWAEGCDGSRVLARDITDRSLRFGLGGKPPRLRGAGLGVQVSPSLLAKHGQGTPIVLNL